MSLQNEVFFHIISTIGFQHEATQIQNEETRKHDSSAQVKGEVNKIQKEKGSAEGTATVKVL